MAEASCEDLGSARALAWLPQEALLLLDRNSVAAPSVSFSEVTCELGLAVLLAQHVQIFRIVKQHGQKWDLRPDCRLHVGFRATCLCWAADGSQLLVGGRGQLVCFAWLAGCRSG